MDSLRFGIRYSATGIATRSYMILYNMIRRLCVSDLMDASGDFRPFLYAVAFKSWLCTLIFRLRKPRV